MPTQTFLIDFLIQDDSGPLLNYSAQIQKHTETNYQLESYITRIEQNFLPEITELNFLSF